MTFMIALLVVALIAVVAKVLPMLFGAAAQRELAGAVPGLVSGLPPTLAVAVRKERRAKKGHRHDEMREARLRGPTISEMDKIEGCDFINDTSYSSLSCNIYHIDY
jgi:hypothetical protein